MFVSGGFLSSLWAEMRQLWNKKFSGHLSILRVFFGFVAFFREYADCVGYYLCVCVVVREVVSLNTLRLFTNEVCAFVRCITINDKAFGALKLNPKNYLFASQFTEGDLTQLHLFDA